MRTLSTITFAATLLAVAQPMQAQDRRAGDARARDSLRARIEQQRHTVEKQNLHFNDLVEQLRAQELALQHIVVPELHDLELMLDLDHVIPDGHEFDLMLEDHLAALPDMRELNAQLEAEQLAMIPQMFELHDLQATLDAERNLFDLQLPHFEYSERESFAAALDRLRGDGPRAAAFPQDPADSLWRTARERFNANNFREAARLFGRIRTESRFANSAYRVDAQYWEAYSLSRLGGESDLKQARDLLRTVVQLPPSQRSRDAEGLLVTVDARLARLGNREAEEALVARATEARSADVARYVQTATTADQARAVAEQAAQTAVWSAYAARCTT